MISIHALLAESDVWPGLLARPFFLISIHALLAESDREREPALSQSSISIHALLAESDFGCWMALNRLLRFLSTLSLRRATARSNGVMPRRGDFYPRSPCGERPNVYRQAAPRGADFYPRSPCGERPVPARDGKRHVYFYPRSPCGERPVAGVQLLGQQYFYPRSPCGERRFGYGFGAGQGKFLSTLSLRRATFQRFILRSLTCDFYPRSPCGERQSNSAQKG